MLDWTSSVPRRSLLLKTTIIFLPQITSLLNVDFLHFSSEHAADFYVLLFMYLQCDKWKIVLMEKNRNGSCRGSFPPYHKTASSLKAQEISLTVHSIGYSFCRIIVFVDNEII